MAGMFHRLISGDPRREQPRKIPAISAAGMSRRWRAMLGGRHSESSVGEPVARCIKEDRTRHTQGSWPLKD
jgi:hypothetical protein